MLVDRLRTHATGLSASALSKAANGEQQPSIDATLAYVAVCDGDIESWRARWHDLRRELSPPRSRRSFPGTAAGSRPTRAAPVASPAGAADGRGHRHDGAGCRGRRNAGPGWSSGRQPATSETRDQHEQAHRPARFPTLKRCSAWPGAVLVGWPVVTARAEGSRGRDERLPGDRCGPQGSRPGGRRWP